MIAPTRLVLARKRRRLTLTQLAEASGVSIRSITAFENGHKRPSPETVASLASALDFPVEFFAQEEIDEIPIEAVSFRAPSKLSAIQRDSARSAAWIAVELNRWLETQFSLPRPDVPTFPHLDPEQAAEQLRAQWALGESPVPNMVHLLEAHGVRVFSLAADCVSVDAFSFLRESRPYVFLNTRKNGERGRFDAAHELGHLVLHSEHRVPHGQEAEQEAQRFASAFLMPRAGLLAQSLVDATPDRILSAKRRWRVAAIALTYRLHELGLLSDWGYRMAAKRLSQLGYRRSEPDGIPRENSQLLAKVFDALRTQQIPPTVLAQALHIDPEELTLHVFGLVTVAMPGGRTGGGVPTRPNLRVLRDGMGVENNGPWQPLAT